jgi:hypothetical protein
MVKRKEMRKTKSSYITVYIFRMRRTLMDNSSMKKNNIYMIQVDGFVSVMHEAVVIGIKAHTT